MVDASYPHPRVTRPFPFYNIHNLHNTNGDDIQCNTHHISIHTICTLFRTKQQLLGYMYTKEKHKIKKDEILTKMKATTHTVLF